MTGDIPRDPISEKRAVRDEPRKSVSDMSSREIEEEIVHTRAHLSSTLNAIEERVSPARLKYELQETLFDTVDRVGERFHPQKIARRAGDNMMDTIKDNPVPAMLAGLSIGYMIIKGSDNDGDRRSYRNGRYRARSFEPQYEREMYRDEVYPSRHPEYPAQYSSEEGESRMRGRASDLRGQAEGRASQARDRAGEALGEAQQRAGETAEEFKHRADDAMREARHQARRMGRNVSRQARRAENTVEDFVYDNPLMAGLVAAGAGALLASLLPSTDFEDRRMGPIRDDLMDDVSEMAGEAQERALNVADDAKEELKESGERVAESAKTEAQQMRASAEKRQSDGTSGRSQQTSEPQKGGRSPAL